MSFTSTYSSLSSRGWQSSTGGQQIYSQIASQFGPPNNRAYFGEFVGISDYTIGNRNLSVSGGSASSAFPNGVIRGSFSTTAFETFGGIRETFTGSNGSTSFGTHCNISADGKYIAVSGNGNIGTAGNLNIYSADTNYLFTLQYANAPNAGSYRNQGIAINDDGTAVAVGAGSANRVDVYNRSGNTWSFTTSVTPNVGNISQSGFGSEISYSSNNNTLVVGAPGGPSVVGTAFIYVNNSQVARIFPSTSSTDDNFGTDVAISGDANYLVVGSTRTATTGRAFVYANVANTWTEIAILSPPSNLTPNITFGGSVAISNNGDTVVVGGVYAANLSGFTKGFVSVYYKNDNSYIETQTLFSPVTTSPTTADNFAYDIGLTRDGKRLIISDVIANNGSQQTGAVYLYQSLY